MDKYVNKPHIEKVIGPLIDNENPISEYKHGELLKSSIFWNPNNLVKGPLPENRADDPGSEIDKEILNQQSDEYKECAKPFINNNQTFDDFANFPPTKPVEWSKDPNHPKHPGKYVVQVTLKYIIKIY